MSVDGEDVEMLNGWQTSRLLQAQAAAGRKLAFAVPARAADQGRSAASPRRCRRCRRAAGPGRRCRVDAGRGRRGHGARGALRAARARRSALSSSSGCGRRKQE